MSLLNVERIKLFSTKSPYWCLLLILVLAGGISALVAVNSNSSEISMANAQLWSGFGLYIMMVMAALSVTTEYRFGTIRSSFLAVPNRTKVFASKTALVALIAAGIGLICAFLAFLMINLLGPDGASLSLSSGTDWRILTAVPVSFAIASVIAISVGVMVRQSAGAISIVIIWPLLVEGLVFQISDSLRDISHWLPFQAISQWSNDPERPSFASEGMDNLPTPLQGLLIFIGTAAVLWIIALAVLKRRDA